MIGAATYNATLDAAIEAKEAQKRYLRRFGWTETCNTPGAYWMWRRDFAAEDAKRLRSWEEGGPGPYGWPSKPQAWGVITAPLDVAVMMTASTLDTDSEPSGEEEA